MKLIKKFMILMLICSCICMSGCWDKVEIDKKFFISMIGIDPGKDIDEEKEIKKLPNQSSFSNSNFEKLNITYAFPNIGQLSPEKGGSTNENSINVNAYSMADGVKKIIEKSSRTISFGHLEVIVLNKKILEHRDTFKEILDYLQREPSINRMVYLVFTEENTEDMLKFQPDVEKSIENYMVGMLENNKKNNTSFPLKFNDFLKNITSYNNTIVPIVNIDKNKKQLKIDKVGLVKNYKLVGYLGNYEGNTVSLLNGNFKKGTRSIVKEGSVLDYSVENYERKIRVSNNKDKLKFDIYIFLEGEIKGYNVDKNIFSNEQIMVIQDYFNKVIEKESTEVLKKTQGEYNTDVIGLKDYLYKYHPRIWSKVKNNWDEDYRNLPISIHVSSKIRRMGATK
ncbi:Ger(x)C family spore germination protein [Clostridium niameyense]|uniref:Ger(X)C family spore germination protein n=1 Tax=Clostridium niameyense TaxID=1622073 RepID=A0A6M0RAW2_9CLOT|nr:Ger(x)C family spore germination protein [Clostridium niameyense]NEZ47404.1 Ger(x)C family spore germination protein [Clostridium niameyense]